MQHHRHVHRADGHHHIAQIQASLEQMKEQANEYLGKHAIDVTPHYVHPHNYLIVDFANDSLLFDPKPHAQPQQKPKHNPEHSHEIANQKQRDEQLQMFRSRKTGPLSRPSSRTEGNFGLTLPTICNVKLDVHQKRNLTEYKTPPLRSKHGENKYDKFKTVQPSEDAQTLLRQRKYRSIDTKQLTIFHSSKRFHNEAGPKSSRAYQQRSKSPQMTQGRNIFDIPVEEYINMRTIDPNMIIPSKQENTSTAGQIHSVKPESRNSKTETAPLLTIDHQKITPIERIPQYRQALNAEETQKLEMMLGTHNRKHEQVITHKRVSAQPKKEGFKSLELAHKQSSYTECCPWKDAPEQPDLPVFEENDGTQQEM